MTAKCILAGGILLAGAAFIFVTMWLRYEFFIPNVIAGPIAMIPALGVGLAIGLLSERFPRVLKLRCRSCGWTRVMAVESRAYGSRGSAPWQRDNSNQSSDPPQ